MVSSWWLKMWLRSICHVLYWHLWTRSACSERSISKNFFFYFKLIETILEQDKYTILGIFEAYLMILYHFFATKYRNKLVTIK